MDDLDVLVVFSERILACGEARAVRTGVDAAALSSGLIATRGGEGEDCLELGALSVRLFIEAASREAAAVDLAVIGDEARRPTETERTGVTEVGRGAIDFLTWPCPATGGEASSAGGTGTEAAPPLEWQLVKVDGAGTEAAPLREPRYETADGASSGSPLMCSFECQAGSV